MYIMSDGEQLDSKFYFREEGFSSLGFCQILRAQATRCDLRSAGSMEWLLDKAPRAT